MVRPSCPAELRLAFCALASLSFDRHHDGSSQGFSSMSAWTGPVCQVKPVILVGNLPTKGCSMARGFTWGTYFDDLGRTWALQVDDDYFRSPERGWFTQATPGSSPFPRGWLPRRVIGIEPSGSFHTAVSPSTSSPIWIGTASQFTIEATDGQLVTCTVTGRFQERRGRAP